MLILPFINSANGQTCCSAGAPLSNILTVSSGANNTFIINLNYEYKGINLLIDNGDRLVNDPRSRFGQSATIKLDYILNKKWSFSTIIPFVHQSRKTFSIKESTFGVGDITLFAQYSILNNNDTNVTLSGGLKLPIGITDHRNDLQILLSPDMQSGSGTYDFISSLYVGRNHFLIPFFGVNAEILYRQNTINDDFGATESFAGRMFGFGDEITSTLGVNYQFIKESGFYIIDAGLRYRWSSNNIENNVNAPNSGGNWISVPLGLTYQTTASNTLRVYAEFPVYQRLNGLQITTSFTTGAQLRLAINNKE